MNRPTITKIVLGALFFAINFSQAQTNTYGLVGLRPLSRTKADHNRKHGGSWDGTPTYADQKGNYPSTLGSGLYQMAH